ncbi:MAG: hypothetical protein FWD12_08895 [Alphaproteobacteria bacterium]|nr:hypothetical protein [Alphaproteobacteria bacterium]
MSNARIDETQRRDEGAILTVRHGRHAARTSIGGDRDRNACAGVLIMARPGIDRIGIDKGGDLVQQGSKSAFAHIHCVQVGWNVAYVRRLDVGATSDGIGAGGEGCEIVRNPVGADARIGIGGEQYAVGPGEVRCALHGDASRLPGARCRICQLNHKRVHRERQALLQRAHELYASVAAIVEADHHGINRRATLRRQREQAPADLRRLVARGDGDDDATPIKPGRRVLVQHGLEDNSPRLFQMLQRAAHREVRLDRLTIPWWRSIGVSRAPDEVIGFRMRIE